MPLPEDYRRAVALLVRLLPAIAEESCFALKGGTAINLFERAMPRLSVDIDLTYLPSEDRDTALRGVEAALLRIGERIRAAMPAAIERVKTKEEGRVYRLNVRSGQAEVKIEVTPVLRGSVFDTRLMRVSDPVEEQFGFAEMPVVSFADLYAGKIMAALDRQHPRDLFDVHQLLEIDGITDALRHAFLVYLVSHGRRMAEILAPTRKDIAQEFETGFAGMTTVPITLDDLLTAREALIATIVGQMPLAHRHFLLDIKSKGEGDWEGLGIGPACALPAVQWRLLNLAKLSASERNAQSERLAEILGLRSQVVDCRR